MEFGVKIICYAIRDVVLKDFAIPLHDIRRLFGENNNLRIVGVSTLGAWFGAAPAAGFALRFLRSLSTLRFQKKRDAPVVTSK